MEQKEPFLKIALAFTAVYIIWGSTYLMIRFAIETLPPFLMAGIRFLTAGVILFLYIKPRMKTPLKPVHWKSSFIVGGFLLLGGNGGVVWAEQFVPSGLTAVLIATVPLWIVVIGLVLKSTGKTSGVTIAGVLLGFAGLFVLVNPLNISAAHINLPGALVILGAAFSWAVGTVYARHAVNPEGLAASAMQMICGGFLLTLTGLVTGEASAINYAAISLKSFGAFLYLIFVGSIIGFTSYIYLIKAAGPSKASTYAYVNPVVAVFLGWLLAGEEINLRIIAATVIIIVSVILINTNFRKYSVKENNTV